MLAAESWRKTLYALFAAEFVAMTAFSFSGPFMPLFVEQVGRFTPNEAAFWNGIGSGGFGIAMFVGSALWGIVADRWGRKPMVIRALLLGAVFLVLQGLSPNIYFLTAMRWGQGLFTGSVAAASALTTAIVPRNKIPFAVGLIMASVSAGSALGPVIGGYLGDRIGYSGVFYLTGVVLLISALIVFWLVQEKFEPLPQRQRASLTSMLRLAVSPVMLRVLVLLFALGLSPSITGPIIPLFIKELNPDGQASTAAGLTFGVMGAAFTLSSLVAARMTERINLKKILVFSCLGVGLLTLLPVWAATVPQLVIFPVLGALAAGGIIASSNAVVGLSVAAGQEGMAYGLSTSAGALAGGIGPLVGGTLASVWGFRPMFAIAAGIYLLVTTYTVYFLPKKLFPEPGIF